MNAPQFLLYAADTLALSALIPGLAWVAAKAFPTRANMRHLVWLAATLILLILPLVTAVVPPQIVLSRAAEAMSVAAPLTGLSATVSTAAETAPDAAPAFTLPGSGEVAMVLAACWLAGGAAVALRGVIATLGLRALRRTSAPHDVASLDLPPALSAGPWELRVSKAAGGPVTWGVFKPTVLVPEAALQWPRQRLEAVLHHELAHVRRRDSLTQSLSMLACALYWPNPMVWIAARALRREAEIAADDAVIASGVKPSDYAGELLRLANEYRQRRPAFGGVSMATQSALTARVQAILSPTSQRTGVTVMDRVKIACLALAATSTLALARPGLAEPVAAPEPADAYAVDSAPLPPVPPAPPAAPAPPAPPSPPAAIHEAHVHAAEARAHSAEIRAEAAQARADAARARAEAAAGRADAAQAREEARRALAQVGPKVREALNDAHIDETVTKALEETRPQILAARTQALAELGPQIRKAIADAHIDERTARAVADAHIEERVAKALAEAQPRIDAALARARREQAAEAAKDQN